MVNWIGNVENAQTIILFLYVLINVIEMHLQKFRIFRSDLHIRFHIQIEGIEIIT